MHWFSNLAIGTRLSLSSAALSAAVVILITALAAASMPRNSLVEHSGNIIVGQLANGATEYILDRDSLALQALLNDLSRQSIIAYASVEDTTHSILAESSSRSNTGKDTREFTSSIQIHDTVVGYTRVKLAGTTAPAISPATVLLLGALVFTAAFAMMQLYLKRFYKTLQNVTSRLGIDQGKHPYGTFGELDRICQTLEKLTSKLPQAAASRRAVLAVRLPDLATANIESGQLAGVLESLSRLAQREQAELQARAEGYLLLFTTGDDATCRALQAGHSLQLLLANNINYSLAIAREEKSNDPDLPVEYDFLWQQLCEATYQSANQENTLLLWRSALSDQAVHDQVSVAQDDAGHYRVTGFHSPTESCELPVVAANANTDSSAPADASLAS